jgi:hypothetical protein
MLARELTCVRGSLRDIREQLQAKRERMQHLRRRAGELDGTRRSARMIRLHSAHHHFEYSERRFVRLARSQFVHPVLVAKRDGRRWWWYSDRFWWAEASLSAREVEALVRRCDLDQRQRSDELARARADILGEERPQQSVQLSPVVRFAVWCRDRGRCVDCAANTEVGYDQIMPFSRGGWRWIANVELPCAACCERRRHDELRTRVGRARIEAVSAVR